MEVNYPKLTPLQVDASIASNLDNSKVCLCDTNCHLYHKDPCPKRGLNHSEVVIRRPNEYE